MVQLVPEGLPAGLPDGLEYLQAESIGISQNGQGMTDLIQSTESVIRFPIPQEYRDRSLQILVFENGSWSKLDTVLGADGTAESNFKGSG
jgi:hypothetical protein